MVANRSPAGIYRVKTATLPSLIREYGQPDFIKVDIEGGDRDCVLSITAEIAPRYLSLEAPADIADLIDHLSSIGFKRFKAVQQFTRQASEHSIGRNALVTASPEGLPGQWDTMNRDAFDETGTPLFSNTAPALVLGKAMADINQPTRLLPNGIRRAR